MSKKAYVVAIIFIAAASTVLAQARGINDSVSGAKFYGPVYGWRYSPPPAAASEPACTWTKVREVRNGHASMRRVRQC